ncbi:MAG: TetR/AcrR family transcriptional regulator [Paracoccus sp. BP8]|uniref:TetR/AcrR family transcriptional regulator n=1 Tax=Paracoccus sp. J39 TaxID=935848 RepID=UPI00048EB35C|nr:TetR/AcrR family transcriptional regulator [Paracoccus sp. J39]RQP04145.1 MAG: TetR/AcrR family transcriptional regulator [Paracoccus sp. BP8]
MAAKPSTVERQATRKAETTRQEILTAAAHLFSEKGYSDCNLRELAERVGMKAGSFYYHFKSKEEILDELLVGAIALVSEAVERAVRDQGSDAPYLDRLVAAMRAHITPYIEWRDDSAAALMRVWEHTPPAMRHRKLEKRREYAQIWYDLIEEGIDRGVIRPGMNLRILVPFLLGSMSRVQEWFSPKHMTIDEVCDHVIRLLLEGALAPGYRL